MNANANTASQSRDLRGQWGGEHIAMEVTDEGATSNTTARTAALPKRLLPTRTESSKPKGFTSASAAVRRGKVKMRVSRPSIVVRSKMKR